MATRTRLTNNAEETDIASLISPDVIFSIPYFQRPYKWKPERLRQFQSDLLSLVDGSADVHFLGAIIVHGRRTNPSDPDIYDVIDGQQCITTIFLYICAVIRFLILIDKRDEAVGLFQKYIIINRNLRNSSNSKIHSCKEDRAQLNAVIRTLTSDAKFKENLGSFKFQPIPIAANSKDKGAIERNYKIAVRFFKSEYAEGGIERVRSIYECLLNQMSVVQIDVLDPISGPKIFDSLNSRQEPITIGDLVRNGIFSRVVDQDPDTIESIDRDYWQPFYSGFEQDGRNLFDAYFFPFGLIKNPNLKKSDVYNALRKGWHDEADPEKLIEELSEYQGAFIDIVCGTNRQNHEQSVAKGFKNLGMLGSPSSTYPFLMQLSWAIKSGLVPSAEGEEILLGLESFLVRRAICGHEPTGLHAVFKRLWLDCDGEYNWERVAKEISKHRTVTWPNNDEFKTSVKNRPLYKATITSYVILEYDRNLSGDTPNDPPWIEHVLPQTLNKDWSQLFDRKQHETLKDCIANLVPLSSEMNRSLGNRKYAEKRQRYSRESMFQSTRDFAERFRVWNPKNLQKRADEFANWACQRWPHNRS